MLFPFHFFIYPFPHSLPPFSLIHLSSSPPSHLLHPSSYFVGPNHLGRYGVPQPRVRSLLLSVAEVTSLFSLLHMPFNGMVISPASTTPPSSHSESPQRFQLGHHLLLHQGHHPPPPQSPHDGPLPHPPHTMNSVSLRTSRLLPATTSM